MTVTQYLGTGSVSRGRLTITRQLNTVVSTPPYLHDENDKAAVVQGLINLQESLATVANITWITPRSNVTAAQFVNSVSQLKAAGFIVLREGNPTNADIQGPGHAIPKGLKPLDW